MSISVFEVEIKTNCTTDDVSVLEQPTDRVSAFCYHCRDDVCMGETINKVEPRDIFTVRIALNLSLFQLNSPELHFTEVRVEVNSDGITNFDDLKR